MIKHLQGRRSAGFTLIEMMITVAILGILAAVALPSYQSQMVRTRRAAATGCVMELAQFMERVYAANIRYDQDAGAATALPATPCRKDLNGIYTFSFDSGQPQARTYTLLAVPAGAQATRDADCGSLSINQANVKAISGTKAVAQCWR
jgi:type IV pilus assembly protein PilE